MRTAHFQTVLRTVFSLLIFSIIPLSARAWIGEPWEEITRPDILSRGAGMVDMNWSPRVGFRNYVSPGNYSHYHSYQTYQGMAYSTKYIWAGYRETQNWIEFSQAMEQITFFPNSTVYNPQAMNIRHGPGTGFAIKGLLPATSTSTILNQVDNGTVANGSTWWYGNFNGQTGWVAGANSTTDWLLLNGTPEWNAITQEGTFYGTNCSGFVSMSWKLPIRLTAPEFTACSYPYCYALGAPGTCHQVDLRPGDACTTSGHIILVEWVSGTGVYSMEETFWPAGAQRRFRSWTNLTTNDYMPIRRTRILGTPTPSTTPTISPTPTTSPTPSPFATPLPPSASFPFFDGFEAGKLGGGWSVQVTDEGRVRLSSGYAYQGAWSALLDDSAPNSTFSTAALILTIDLAGESSIYLDFWWREFMDEDNAEDGVFISDDYGSNWHRIVSFNNGTSAYLHSVTDIVTAAGAAGVALNDHFQIKFQFYDNYPIGPPPNTDGYSIDNVWVRPAGSPSPPASTPTPQEPTATPSVIPGRGALPWIADYNGDGTSDIAVFRETSGLWAVRNLTRTYFGGPSDLPVPADFDGDGSTDIGIFRETLGLWALRGVSRIYFGSSSDTSIPGDYDGNGTADVGIFRTTSGLWAIRGVTRSYFGATGDIPVPGYYAGDGTQDIGLFRRSSGLWAIRAISRIYFGGSLDETVPGDYDGDGSWDIGIFRPDMGLWAIRGVTRSYFGGSTDDALPADYNGDGMDRIGIFRAGSGLWAVQGVTRAYFGATGDIPVTR